VSLEESDTLELLDRFDNLVRKYVPLAAELAPKIEKFGKLRKELQAIVSELVQRGVTPQDPDELTKMMEGALAERGMLEE